MVTKEAIDAALSAHAQWKTRLENAIATSQSESRPDIVKKDNVCQFGQWLYALSAEDAKSEDYKKVKELHADFHATAGAILELALSGKKEEAKREMEVGGSYRKATGKLVLALESWKSKL
jgi:hypothetical protein